MVRRVHVFARVSLGSAAFGLIVNLVVGLLVHQRVFLAWGLALDNLMLTAVLGLVSIALGIETFVKYRWPGETVAARAHAPQMPDLEFAAAALILTSLNAVLSWRWLESMDAFA